MRASVRAQLTPARVAAARSRRLVREVRITGVGRSPLDARSDSFHEQNNGFGILRCHSATTINTTNYSPARDIGVVSRVTIALRQPPLWVTLIVCGAILIFRRAELIASPQFWAEDGLIFYTEAYNHGMGALSAPYAGYLHALPRIIAAVAARADPLLAPAIFVWSALVLTLYVAARTQSRRSGLPRHAGFALAVVCVPDTFEVLLLLVNVQWILAAGFLLLLISRDPQSGGQWAHDVAAPLLLGLTGPFSIVFSPLFLWRAVVRRTKGSIVIGAVVLLTAVVQAVTIATHPVVMIGEQITPAAALTVPGMRIGASLLIGGLVTTLDFPTLFEHLLTALTAGGLAFLVMRRGEDRLERVWLGCALAILLASSLYRCRYVLPDLSTAGFGARYFYPPQLVALWLLMALAWDARRAVAATGVALALWSFAVNVPRLRESPLQDFNWPQHAERLRRGEAAEIPINPDWTIKLRAR